MMRTLKEIYGVWILIFYFIKWPYLIGFGYLYIAKGLKENWVLNLFWILFFILALKDLLILLLRLLKQPPKE